MKPLKHADPMTVYEDEVQAGDHVIYQRIVDEHTESGIPTITIEVLEIESNNPDTGYFRVKDNPISLPTYRITYVIQDNIAYSYKGYDMFAIQRDEGVITDETYDKIKRHQEALSLAKAQLSEDIDNLAAHLGIKKEEGEYRCS